MAKHKFQSAAVLPDHKRKVRSKVKHFIKSSPPLHPNALILSIFKRPHFILNNSLNLRELNGSYFLSNKKSNFNNFFSNIYISEFMFFWASNTF